MRKGLVLLLATVLAVGLFGLVSAAGINDTPHDMASVAGTKITVQGGVPPVRLCDPCHVPHSAKARGGAWSQLLLWNGTIRGAAPNSFYLWATGDYIYTTWRNAAGTISPLNYGGLDTGSRRCLGCHDGGTFYVFTGGAGGWATAAITATVEPKKITDLRKTHPVGVSYASNIAFYPQFQPQASAEAAGINFSEGKVGCGSCHDPHNTVNNGQFIRVSLTDSLLCTACHNK